MKGPTLHGKSHLPNGSDTEPAISPEEMIETFKDEILTTVCESEYEQDRDEDIVPASLRKQPRNRASDQYNAELVALYLGRFWSLKNPWWADEALCATFRADLPAAKSVQVAHEEAMELRKRMPARQLGQMRRRFEDALLKDMVFFQILTIVEAGITQKAASEGIAEWLEWFAKGNASDREKYDLPRPPKRQWTAYTLEREFRRWRRDPLKGRLWAEAIVENLGQMDEPRRKELRNNLGKRMDALGPVRARLRGASN